MPIGGVPGHQVEQDADTAAARLVDERGQVVGGAVARRDGEVVGDVVPASRKGETKQGLSHTVLTPSHSRWSRRSAIPLKSPMPSPSESANDCG